MTHHSCCIPRSRKIKRARWCINQRGASGRMQHTDADIGSRVCGEQKRLRTTSGKTTAEGIVGLSYPGLRETAAKCKNEAKKSCRSCDHPGNSQQPPLGKRLSTYAEVPQITLYEQRSKTMQKQLHGPTADSGKTREGYGRKEGRKHDPGLAFSSSSTTHPQGAVLEYRPYRAMCCT